MHPHCDKDQLWTIDSDQRCSEEAKAPIYSQMRAFSPYQPCISSKLLAQCEPQQNSRFSAILGNGIFKEHKYKAKRLKAFISANMHHEDIRDKREIVYPFTAIV
ncbi:hypothetical protein KIN20_006240 [Parelaphostrongylus tenuis]|uniref:Uncharacterized protein n=1 Tax=Parelaphostrongylus tenuis TaxID=148309 RepID=A0AAD5MMA7_PARTN|nr:hypothetical protein KIN20_006240 [Parelaphostrongylus tenuis]